MGLKADRMTRRRRAAPAATVRFKEVFPLSPLGGQIRDLRAARGLSLARLAEEIGKSVGYVSQIERGARRSRGSTLKLLSLIQSKGLDAVL